MNQCIVPKPEPQTCDCRIELVEAMNREVYRVRLRPERAVAYLAGQYLELLLPEGRGVPFSIASAPHQPWLELNVMHQPGSATSSAVMAHLSRSETVEVRLPMGDCVLDASRLNGSERLIFIAASTGFAQVKSLVAHALHHQLAGDLKVFWGVRTPEHLYDLELLESWGAGAERLSYELVVSDPQPGQSWKGATGLVHERALAQLEGFEDTRIYVCGSPGMVYAVEDACRERGMKDGCMLSDVFSWAPRR